MIPKTAIATYFLARELNQLFMGATLAKIEYDRDSKTFRFLISSEKKHHIIFSFAPVTFLCLEDWPGQGESFNIWQELTPSTITNIAGEHGNRLIRLNCDRPQENLDPLRFTVVFELFGAQSNAYLLDAQDQIVQAARVVTDDRGLRPRAPYTPPEPMTNIPDSGNALVAEFAGNRFTVDYRNDEYSLKGTTTPPDTQSPLVSLFREIHDQYHERMRFESRLKDYKGRLRKLIGKQRQLIAQLQKQLDECNQSEMFSSYGDLLMAHPHTKPVDGTLTVSDFYTGQDVTIPLEAGKTVIETAGIFYKRSKKLQRSIKPLNDRIIKAKHQIELLETASTELDHIDNEDALAALVTRLNLKELSFVSADDEQPTSRFYRIFESSAGEKIFVGKSSEGNDVLTFKTARSWDIWFHVGQNIPGSHVILVLPDKNRAPSKVSIEEAARIAAYYSDMRRVTNVPIIYTERRYVRKMRKGGPGQVIYQNVKSLFVDPALPPTATEQD